jgi:hypothetical protein
VGKCDLKCCTMGLLAGLLSPWLMVLALCCCDGHKDGMHIRYEAEDGKG